MSYIRPFGDAITSPSQVDPTLPKSGGPVQSPPFDPNSSITVGEVTPTRVPCDALPADSPWKRPGQVCAPQPGDGGGLLDSVDRLIASWQGQPTTAPAADNTSTLLMLAGAGALAYFLLRKKRG